MPYTAHIRKIATGDVIPVAFSDPVEAVTKHLWMTGPYSCDCQRAVLRKERSNCGFTGYKVVCVADDGSQFFSDDG